MTGVKADPWKAEENVDQEVAFRHTSLVSFELVVLNAVKSFK
jgi:hypothetical protein